MRIEMLGQFRIVLDDRQVTARDWPSRRAHALVALLALADGRTLLRDQVVEQLWPHLGAEAGAANLCKAAHHARRTLGHQEAIVLRSGRVELLPARSVSVDVEDFVRDAQLALRDADADTCAKVAARCPGELLPDAPYESWTQEPRWQVHAHRTELLRRAGDWQRLMEVEPTDEAACRELMRTAIDAGRRHVAIRWFERLRIAMLRELGAQPDAATLALSDQCTAGVRLSERAFVGREIELAQAAAHRIYGAMIEGAGNAAAGVRLVREAETAIQGPAETCPTCRIAFVVPATIAAARGGDLARAHRYAQDCDKALEIVALPPAWHAALEEARGWVTHADGRACTPGARGQ